MQKVLKNLRRVQKVLQKFPNAKLVAVTKNCDLNEIEFVLKNGIEIIGENRVLQAEKKFSQLKNHAFQKRLIGHLQTNKVKKAVEIFDAIDSVDSLKLVEKINSAATFFRKKMPILLQVNLDKSKTKSGFTPENFSKVCKKIVQFQNVKVCGLMTMPDSINSEKSFQDLNLLFKKIEQEKIFDDNFQELSMGTSLDFQLALKNGATLVRLGRTIFGK